MIFAAEERIMWEFRKKKKNAVLFLLNKAWNGAWRRTDEFMLLLPESNGFCKPYFMNNRCYLEEGTGDEVLYKKANYSPWGSNIYILSLLSCYEWKGFDKCLKHVTQISYLFRLQSFQSFFHSAFTLVNLVQKILHHIIKS